MRRGRRSARRHLLDWPALHDAQRHPIQGRAPGWDKLLADRTLGRQPDIRIEELRLNRYSVDSVLRFSGAASGRFMRDQFRFRT